MVLGKQTFHIPESHLAVGTKRPGPINSMIIHRTQQIIHTRSKYWGPLFDAWQWLKSYLNLERPSSLRYYTSLDVVFDLWHQKWKNNNWASLCNCYFLFSPKDCRKCEKEEKKSITHTLPHNCALLIRWRMKICTTNTKDAQKYNKTQNTKNTEYLNCCVFCIRIVRNGKWRKDCSPLHTLIHTPIVVHFCWEQEQNIARIANAVQCHN